MEFRALATGVTFYPGIGADEATKELNSLVGQITAAWAGVEDGLFEIFVIAIAGTFFVENIAPYRAVFFTFSAYEGKMRMTNNAMKGRYEGSTEILRQ